MQHDALFYRQLMLWIWLLWLLYWVVSATRTKPTERTESFSSRLSYVLLLAVGVMLIVWPHTGRGWWTMRLLPDSELTYAIATCLVAAGLAFSVWARMHLGGNWSGSVTLKQGHELVRSGPYAYARHPIYTGVLLALLGSAIECGELRAALGLALVAAAFLHKLRMEERLMRETFPAEYERYSAEVPALIPFTRVRRSAPH